MTHKTPLIITITILALLALAAGITAIALNLNSPTAAAERCMSELDYEGAIAEYERVIDEDPENVMAYSGLIKACEAVGDPYRAEEVRQEALKRTGNRRFGAAAITEGAVKGGVELATSPTERETAVPEIIEVTGTVSQKTSAVVTTVDKSTDTTKAPETTVAATTAPETTKATTTKATTTKAKTTKATTTKSKTTKATTTKAKTTKATTTKAKTTKATTTKAKTTKATQVTTVIEFTRTTTAAPVTTTPSNGWNSGGIPAVITTTTTFGLFPVENTTPDYILTGATPPTFSFVWPEDDFHTVTTTTEQQTTIGNGLRVESISLAYDD